MYSVPILFSSYSHRAHPDLHSFPTRRSSDLGAHTMKVGFEGRMLRVNVWEARSAGTFNFRANETQGPNPNTASSTAGVGFASDRKSTRLNSSHDQISYAVFCLKKKKKKRREI